MRRFLPIILELVGVAGCAETAASVEPGPARSAERIELLASSPPPRPTPSATASARPSLRRRLRTITRGRYMEGRCKKATYRGWEHYPVRHCRYGVPDATGHKSADVLLLNPSAKRLARWIESACADLGEGCENRLVERILIQSSAQFPVAGIVLEDIRPADRHFEMYCFRDGVRVEVEGFHTLSTERPTEAHFRTCLEGPLLRPTAFARIAGTTPNEYRAAGGLEVVGDDHAPDPRWLDVTRTLYQAAYQSDDNQLISAWAEAHLGRRQP